MSVNDIISAVIGCCKRCGVEHLSLFGSFAKGTAVETSDIDFVVYGCEDKQHLENCIADINTLRKIDIFFYDEIVNDLLLEDIKNYEKQIF